MYSSYKKNNIAKYHQKKKLTPFFCHNIAAMRLTQFVICTSVLSY